jgi:hypothetical protein
MKKFEAAKTEALTISDIITTGGTQIRAAVNSDTVDQYAEAMNGGDEFPPLIVFHDGSRYILADGFHRIMAASRNGAKEIKCEIRKGTKSDAIKFALSANSKHGLQRTNRDKRRSVELALAEWPNLSDREFAKICAVSFMLVASIRRELPTYCSPNPAKRIGADGKSRKMPTRKGPAPSFKKEDNAFQTKTTPESIDANLNKVEEIVKMIIEILDKQDGEGLRNMMNLVEPLVDFYGKYGTNKS